MKTRSNHPATTVLRMMAAALVASLAASAARAELVDYGALEQLFGEPVTTSATGQPQRVTDAPVDMMIITAEDIRRSGAPDVAGVLRHAGGLDMLQWTSGQTDVSVRGYDTEFNPRVLVLVDGRQVYADHYGFMPWSALPVQLDEIRQIEIVKGPNAALFGFNAVGGVINIVTYNPLLDDVGAASAIVGTQDLVGGSAVETFHLGDRGAVRLSLGGQDATDFDTPVPSVIGYERTKEDERRSVRLDGVLKLGDRAHLRLDAGYSEADLNDMGPGLNLVGIDHKTSFVQGQLGVDTGLGLLEATAYTNRIATLSDPTPILPSYDFDNRVSVLRMQDLFTAGAAHTFRIAGEYRRTSVNTTPVGGAEVAYAVRALSGMWDIKISPSLQLTNAVRFDQLELEREGYIPPGYPFTNAEWNRSIEEVSFNSGLVWRVDDADTLRFIAGRGVQLPSLFTLGADLIVSPAFNATGVPTIDPSPVTSYEVQWDRKLPALDASLRAGVFYQLTEDVANTDGGIIAAQTGFYFTPATVGDSAARGLEIGLEGGRGGAWRWSVDYRAEQVDDDRLPPFDSVPLVADFEHRTPEHLLQASLGWTGGRWEADAFVRHQSATGAVRVGVAGSEFVPVDAYTALDGRVGYALTDHLSVALSGQNLGAPEQRQTAGPNVERRLFVKLTYRR